MQRSNTPTTTPGASNGSVQTNLKRAPATLSLVCMFTIAIVYMHEFPCCVLLWDVHIQRLGVVGSSPTGDTLLVLATWAYIISSAHHTDRYTHLFKYPFPSFRLSVRRRRANPKGGLGVYHHQFVFVPIFLLQPLLESSYPITFKQPNSTRCRDPYNTRWRTISYDVINAFA